MTAIRVLRVVGVLALLIGSVLVPAAPAAGATAVITLTWVPDKATCQALAAADCVVAEDGWTLAILDPAVTLADAQDCVDLPKDHGMFAELVAGADDEALFPSSGAELGTGTCQNGTPDTNDLVASDDDNFLIDPIDANLNHKSTATFTGDATFYDVGLGACGQADTNSDLVAALPRSMFDPSPNGNPNLNHNCGRKIKVTSGGKSVIVTVVDRCDGCSFGDIDLSPAAFDRIGNEDEGRVPVSEEFVS